MGQSARYDHLRSDIWGWYSFGLFGSSWCCYGHEVRAVWSQALLFCNDKVRSGFLGFLCSKDLDILIRTPILISYPDSVTRCKRWQFSWSMTLVKVALCGSTAMSLRIRFLFQTGGPLSVHWGTNWLDSLVAVFAGGLPLVARWASSACVGRLT